MSNWTSASPTSKSPPSDTRLTGVSLPVADLSEAHRVAMYGLLNRYFTGVTRERFERDLAEKAWAILLLDSGGSVRGFTTLMRLEAAGAVAFFSGDTIIDQACWGQTELPRTWIRLALTLAEQEGGRPVYWFLISSGYKTYRFLPVFFREFWPTWERQTPPRVKAVLDSLASKKFGAEYDPARGVIRFAEPSPLREGVAEVTEERLKDPAVAFFTRANPGHDQGDELACLTLIDPANLTPAGRRMLGLPREARA